MKYEAPREKRPVGKALGRSINGREVLLHAAIIELDSYVLARVIGAGERAARFIVK